MNTYRERPNFIPWPPLLLVGFTLAAIVLNKVAPLALEFIRDGNAEAGKSENVIARCQSAGMAERRSALA